MSTSTVLCVKCENPIPKARVKALPDTKVCVTCSHERLHSTKDTEIDGPDAADIVRSYHYSGSE